MATALHAALSHLEQQGSCARLIFIDFSTSTALSPSPCSPLGCVLIPLLYTLCTHDCTPTHHSNTVIKFADDTTVVGLISRGEETAHRDEVWSVWWGGAELTTFSSIRQRPRSSLWII